MSGHMYVGPTRVKKVFIGSTKIKKAFVGRTQVYSGATLVTYHVDSGASYSEEVDEGLTVLSPTTFTPSKSGYTFFRMAGRHCRK